MAAARRLRLLAFGASLTEGFYSGGCRFHPYTIRLSQLLQPSFPDVDINNAGVSGEAVLDASMLSRLKRLLTSAKSPFDWVLILAGTNDTLRDQEKPSRIFERYQQLIKECQQHGARVLCMTLPEGNYPRDSPFDRQRQEFNRLIRDELTSNQTENNIVVLDVDQLLQQHSLSPDEQQQIWDDEVHLTPRGYDRLGELVYEALKPHL